MVAKRGWQLLTLCIGVALTLSPALAHAATRIRIIHTNDLHARFRPDKSPLQLGGIGRIKTTVDRLRRENPNSLFVDGGDWSEGAIYYNLDSGTEVIRMMDRLSYDVAVVGNHDWLNGPNILLDSLRKADPKMSLVGANLDLTAYPRKPEFEERIKPYVIRELDGIKIAFIGIVTYDIIYDSFMSPIRITSPMKLTTQLAKELKKTVDLVIAISHNSIEKNKNLLEEAPDLDLVIGAHDHKRLTRPIVVERPGHAPGWIVEAGDWGKFVGVVDLRVAGKGTKSPDGASAITLDNYRLIQMDSRISEDRATAARVDALEKMLIAKYGRIFDDHIADNHVIIDRLGSESRIGNLATDAYRRATGAHLALDQANLIYGTLQPGAVNTVDVMNMHPAVYNPATDRAWTVKTFLMQGRMIEFTLNFLYAFGRSVNYTHPNTSLMSVSGIEFDYAPVYRSPYSAFAAAVNPALSVSLIRANGEDPDFLARNLRIGGQPVHRDLYYRVATSEGIMRAIAFINSKNRSWIPITNVHDTGIEQWKALDQHIKVITPITSEKVQIGNRLRVISPDLGTLREWVTWDIETSDQQLATVRVRAQIKNFGKLASAPKGAVVRFFGNLNRADETREPDLVELSAPHALGKLAPGTVKTVEWRASVPGERGLFPIWIRVDSPGETNASNDTAMRWIQAAVPKAH